MWPFIKDGDVLTVSPLSGRIPGKGDVVAYASPNEKRLRVHRVVDTPQNGGFMIKGDNSDVTDESVPLNDVLGRITKIERGKKTLSLGIGPEGLFIALLSQKSILTGIIRILANIARPFTNRRNPAREI